MGEAYPVRPRKRRWIECALPIESSAATCAVSESDDTESAIREP
jgi:hypothetical protein